jgi:hypothetical protein
VFETAHIIEIKHPRWRRRLGRERGWKTLRSLRRGAAGRRCGPVWWRRSTVNRKTAWGRRTTATRSTAAGPAESAARHATVLAMAFHTRTGELIVGFQSGVAIFGLGSVVQVRGGFRERRRQLGPGFRTPSGWLQLPEPGHEAGEFARLLLERPPIRRIGLQPFGNSFVQSGWPPIEFYHDVPDRRGSSPTTRARRPSRPSFLNRGAVRGVRVHTPIAPDPREQPDREDGRNA